MTKREFLQKILKLMATLVLKKYNPRIVSITGSVGKTSAKEAIFSVLAGKFRVRRNEKNYNNEIGLPLTIIGADSGHGSFLGWLRAFLKWLWVIAVPFEYPEVLVLEMGADRPGDIKYLASFIKSEVGVITDVSMSHIEFFNNIETVAREKGVLVKELGDKGLAVINYDNPHVAKMKELTKASVINFGFDEKADIRATGISFVYNDQKEGASGFFDGEIKGISFKLNYKGNSIPVRLNNILARHQIYSALAASAVGVWFGLNLVEIGTALESFSVPCGRMNLIEGIKNTSIIDDTYNSSPSATMAALEVLREIKATRKIAVLGDMLELGPETESGHKNVGNKFLEIKGDIFFAVGNRMKFAVEELEKNNFPGKNIYVFSDPDSAGRKLQEVMQKGDLILVKGSQSMRMEKVVEEIMAKPQKADELLCRQNKEWKKIPFREV